MRKEVGMIFLIVSILVITQGSSLGETIKVKESISGTVLRTNVDLNGDGQEDGTLGMCFGKGTLGHYTCKTYGESVVIPIGLGEPCDPAWLYAEVQEIDPVNGTSTVWSHIQEFKTGDLLYWAPDWSKTSYYCFDTAPTGKMTFTQYMTYDGGTGRFENASGTVMWFFEIDTRIHGSMWGVEGSVEGTLILED